MSPDGASYRAAGVDYEVLDAGKRQALARALSTSPLLAARGGHAIDASRGEPAFVFELGSQTLAFVVEGLGTKAMIARAVLEQSGVNRFADVAYDTVAAIANDLCCVGALPLVLNAYFATGDLGVVRATASVPRRCSEAGSRPAATRARRGEEASRPRCPGCWPATRSSSPGPPSARWRRVRVRSWARSCAPATRSCCWRAAACTPTAPRSRACSPRGSRTATRRACPTARSFGEALLAPSVMYVPLVQRLLEEKVPVGYLSHITGHGFLKLMRPRRELTYRIERLPQVPAGALVHGRARRARCPRGLLDVQHGRRLRRLLRGGGRRRRSSGSPRSSASRRSWPGR